VTPHYDDLLVSLATVHGLPVNLVRAIVQTESAGDPWAYRHEPGYRWLVGNPTAMSQTERIGQMSSWGLMQVMGAVAREAGFVGPFPQLCDPAIGLDYGCRHLAGYFKKYQNWPDTIASYNAGRPVRNDAGQYANQVYVNKVQTRWNAYDVHDQA